MMPALHGKHLDLRPDHICQGNLPHFEWQFPRVTS